MIKNFIFYFLFVHFTNTQVQNDTKNVNSLMCGQRIKNGEKLPYKIVGGTIAAPGDWGWQVAMLFSGRFTCGGSLINSQWVVTAAHCVYGRNFPALFSFAVGLHDRFLPEKWSTKRKVSKIIVHPQYDQYMLQNDIALIQLESPVNYTSNIIPICISNQLNLTSKQSWATGWGTLKSGGFVSRYLREVQMPILNDTQCQEKFKIVNTSVAICSGQEGQNKDTCQGDSGGPLVVFNNDRWHLAGITSWGFGCGDGGVYTRVSYYYDWIIQSLQNSE